MSEVDYSAVLADLEKRRLELDTAINAIRQILGEGPDDEANVPSGTSTLVDPLQPPRADAFFSMSILDAAKKFLAMGKRPKKAKVIADALLAGGLLNNSPNFAATVSTTLRRERDSGKTVTQLPDKSWALADWYPGGTQRRMSTSLERANEAVDRAKEAVAGARMSGGQTTEPTQPDEQFQNAEQE